MIQDPGRRARSQAFTGRARMFLCSLTPSGRAPKCVRLSLGLCRLSVPAAFALFVDGVDYHHRAQQ